MRPILLSIAIERTRPSLVRERISESAFAQTARACIKPWNARAAGRGRLLPWTSSSTNWRIAWSSILKLLHLGVFCVRLPKNRDVGVRVFPEREEILVGSL